MQVDESKFGYVYRITNQINGKTYIGKHQVKSNEPWTNYMGSGKLIHAAIRKYGPQSFVKELVSYATNSEALASLEIRSIQEEIAAGRGQYNLFFGGNDEVNWGSITELENYPVLEWYLDEKLSTWDIAARIPASQSVVVAYLKRLKDLNPDLDFGKPGVGLKPRKKLQSSIDKQKETFRSNPPAQCEFCGLDFKTNVLKSHQNSCLKNQTKNHLPDCLTCGIKLSKPSALYCKAHMKLKSSMTGNSNAKGNKGGAITAHKRWHVNRGVKSPNCYLCSDSEGSIPS